MFQTFAFVWAWKTARFSDRVNHQVSDEAWMLQDERDSVSTVLLIATVIGSERGLPR
jgi:hypothetical protein